jgi:interferon-induced GTP-binding protein Mx1
VIWKDKPTSSNHSRFGWRQDEDGFAPQTVTKSNWGDLTQLIATAQDFILSKQEKDVARDVIQVEMKCPHCEDLTLIDLPGMVRSHGKDESDTLGEEIQALLNDYLHNSRCVILAVLPANVDFHNSQILAEARKVDKETKRTIPVLTKPDLIDYGAEGNVQELLLGQKTQKFEMGFHMVKGRGQDALNRNVTIPEALGQEEAFFRLTEPWNQVEDKTLFGTQNLRSKLGELQMRLIRSSFESIIAEIKSEREKALQARARLGVVPTDLGQKIVLFRAIKDDFYHEIGPLMLGGGGGGVGNGKSTDIASQRKPSADFLQACKEFMTELDGSRLSTIADISVGTTVVALVNGREIKDRVCNIREDQVYLERVIASSRNTYIPMLDPTSSLTGGFRGKCDDEATLLKYRSIHRNLVRRDSAWIQKIIEDRRPYKLPVFASTDAFDEIVSTLLKEDWRPPSIELLEKASTLMKKTVSDYVASIASIESLSEFRGYLQLISAETIDKLTEEAREKIEDFIRREQTPYTQDEDLIRNLNALRTKRLKDEILTMMDVEMVTTLWEDSDSSETIARRLHDMVTEVFDRNNARELDDHMAEEMQHILNAYGKIARKRFIDGIPMICVEIMQEFPKRINEALSEVTDDVIDSMIVPQPEKIRAMLEYDRKIDAFSNGIAAIRTLY